MHLHREPCSIYELALQISRVCVSNNPFVQVRKVRLRSKLHTSFNHITGTSGSCDRDFYSFFTNVYRVQSRAFHFDSLSSWPLSLAPNLKFTLIVQNV